MNTDVIDVAAQIHAKINEIDKIRAEIRSRGDNKADAIGKYEGSLAVTLIKLKNHTAFVLDGVTVKDPPAVYTKDIAKGICEKEKIEMEKAETLYKSCIVNLEAAQSQLNALQSIYRHLSER